MAVATPIAVSAESSPRPAASRSTVKRALVPASRDTEPVKEDAAQQDRVFLAVLRKRSTGNGTAQLYSLVNTSARIPEATWYRPATMDVAHDLGRFADGDRVTVRVRDDKILRASEPLTQPAKSSANGKPPSTTPAEQKKLDRHHDEQARVQAEHGQAVAKAKSTGLRGKTGRLMKRASAMTDDEVDLALASSRHPGVDPDAVARLQDVARVSVWSDQENADTFGKKRAAVIDTAARRCHTCGRTMAKANEIINGQCMVCRRN